MKRLTMSLVGAVFVLFACQAFVFAQTTGSISGNIVDANGATVVGATVVIKGEGGQEFTAITNESGGFRVPSVASGVYTVTATAPNFKRIIVEGVKVDVGLPSTVNVTLPAGEVSETVVVTGGGEVLQTQTATIGTTITGRQIAETPIASRDALDLIGLLPGTATVGAPRRSSINGLPKGSLAISIDGVDVQDNLLRSSDGFFTYVRPRIDAIEEVTVSTSNPGAEASGDGAVQIKFITKRGTNDYRGTAFWQHRDESLNANYWYSNRDGQRDENGKAYRQKIRLNQFGGSFGGPIPFLRFGDGDDPMFDSGKDRLYFFANYEEYRIPQSNIRNRTILTPAAQAGNFSFVSGGTTQTVNLFDIAAANSQLSTPDQTVATLLSQIRAATATEGSFAPISGSPNYQSYIFSPAGDATRKFLVLRFDGNITKNHSVEFVTNQQEFVPSKDFLNSQDERFPGFPSYTQGSVRDSYSGAVRSNFGNKVINEARVAISTGLSTFSDGISSSDFGNQGGYNLVINPTDVPLTTATSRNSYSNRNTPTYDYTDNVTWLAGSHSIAFGGQYKLIRAESSSIGRIVPSVSFGLDSTDPAFSIFNSAIPTANLTQARNLYAMLIGRVTSYATNAYLTADGTYQENALQSQLAKQNTYGLYVQDSWRARPNLTINLGVRWQPQTAFKVLSANYAKVETFEDAWGVSGFGNIFKPGTLTGRVPKVVAAKVGEKAYNDDNNNFAPTVGFAWTPNFGDKGFLRGLFGASARSVVRGGYSVSFVREGFDLLGSILGSNPGGSLTLTRSLANGNLTVGSNLRDPGNPNLTAPPFPTSPSYPFSLTVADSTNVFNPNLKTGSVHSFNFGYQREVDKNTVVEFRYVGNRGIDLQRQYNINEFNTIENGFATEFALAQANLYSNINAGRGNTFAYFGVGTNTSPLPIMMKYFNTVANNDPLNPARYTAANFANTTLVAALSRNNPTISTFNGTNFENSAARRTNAANNGLPVNFFYVNPTTGTNGSFVVDNSANTWYDSGVIEIRRRLSAGLRMQASYVWSKAQSDAFQSSSVLFSGYTQRENGLDLAKNVQAFDIRHQFKVDATYDLPFGKGRQFFSSSNGFVNALIGGFTILPVVRWQSGSPISLGNVQLVGMTKKELQKAVGVYKNTLIEVPGQPTVQRVTYLPYDIILNTQKAFNISVANTGSNGGYGTTFGSGGPQGRFVAPAGYGNCISKTTGDCGFNNLIIYGPSYFKFDATVAKKFAIGEKRSIELRALFLDAFNMPNFRVGGWGADIPAQTAVGAGTWGQLGTGSAYQDISTTNDNGGRQIDLMLRINF